MRFKETAFLSTQYKLKNMKFNMQFNIRQTSILRIFLFMTLIYDIMVF